MEDFSNEYAIRSKKSIVPAYWGADLFTASSEGREGQAGR